jgi:hypothetical protein
MDTELLTKISKLLDYDFFVHFSAWMRYDTMNVDFYGKGKILNSINENALIRKT